MTTPTHRRCTKCGEEKSLVDFSPHAHGKYGKQPRCRACCAAANRARYAANPGKAKAQRKRHKLDPVKARARRKRWQDKNRERELVMKDDWSKANQNRRRMTRMAWHANNRAAARDATRRYRERFKRAIGECSAEAMTARVEFYGGKCWVPGCGAEFEAMDHIIPLSAGGTNWPGNLRPICWKHNSEKGRSHWRDFLRKVA